MIKLMLADIPVGIEERFDNIVKITRINHEILILHYGLNHVEDVPQQPERFIKLYTKLV